MTAEQEFAKYANDTYPKAIQELTAQLDSTDFSVFHTLVLKFMFVIEHGLISGLNGPNFEHINQIISKSSHELLAFVWCLKGGSLHGAYHHTRSLIEIAAIAKYLDAESDAEKRTVRVKKFYEYRSLAKYQWHMRHKQKFDLGKMSKEQFEEENIITPNDILGFTEDKLKLWIGLWNPKKSDLMKVRNWRHPRSIEDLVNDQELDYIDLYHNLCHVVHVSPLSKGLVDVNLVVQKEQLHRIEELVHLTGSVFYKLIGTLESLLSQKMIPHFSEIFMRFKYMKQ